MKKAWNKKWFLVLALLLVLGMLYLGTRKMTPPTPIPKTVDLELLHLRWGVFVNEGTLTKHDLYAQGKNIPITLKIMEVATSYHGSMEERPDKAREKAYEDVKKDAVIYYHAVASGFTATDEEIADYVDMFKKDYQENKKNGELNPTFKDMIEAEGDEKAMWKSLSISAKETITFDNFKNDWEEKYYAEHPPTPDSNETIPLPTKECAEAWDKYVQELVNAENFKLVK